MPARGEDVVDVRADVRERVVRGGGVDVEMAEIVVWPSLLRGVVARVRVRVARGRALAPWRRGGWRG